MILVSELLLANFGISWVLLMALLSLGWGIWRYLGTGAVAAVMDPPLITRPPRRAAMLLLPVPLLLLLPSAAASRPHIVFVLVDDNGWAGVGYNNPHVSTPKLDALASGGLKLTSQYVYKYCAPTRGSFLTGRYPFKLAATRANLIPWTLPDGTHLGYSMLPKKLKRSGYYSVHVGKWHQGLYTPEYTPVGRGFDESLGFLEGGEDHNTSRTFGNWCRRDEVDLSFGRGGGAHGSSPFPYAWPDCSWRSLGAAAVHAYIDNRSTDIVAYNPFEGRDGGPFRFDSEEGCRRLCANRIDCAGYSWRSTDPQHVHYHKCFLVSTVGGSGRPDNAFRSAVCQRRTQRASAQWPTPTTLPARSLNGTYTGVVFNDAAVRLVREHASQRPTRPMFMYYAMHDTHAPLEAPWRFVAPYAARWPADSKRATFSGMLAFVDEAVGNLTETLHDVGMWSNTLFVWTNDNGSPVSVGGSNHPLRGGKGSTTSVTYKYHDRKSGLTESCLCFAMPILIPM
eukprot:COSAG01_NODE_2537_length_7450_cov_5.509411_4_plen_508_part_00